MRTRLADLKKTTQEKFEKEHATGRIDVTPLRLAEKAAETMEIAVDGGTVSVPKTAEISERPNARIWQLKYGGLSVQVIRKTAGQNHDYDSLPAAWGGDDLAKILYLAPVSTADIALAATPKELEEIVTKLTAKETIMPLGAARKLVKIEASFGGGLLSGDLDQGTGMIAIFRLKDQPDTTLCLRFNSKDRTATSQQVIDYLSSIRWTAAPQEAAE